MGLGVCFAGKEGYEFLMEKMLMGFFRKMIGKKGLKSFLFPSSFNGLAGFYFCEFSASLAIIALLAPQTKLTFS